jgi:hypothetical protein
MAGCFDVTPTTTNTVTKTGSRTTGESRKVRKIVLCYSKEFLATGLEVSGSIPGATRFSEE